MPAYQYEALKMSDRSKVNGLITAGTEKEARELLREQDLMPTKLLLITGGASRSGKKEGNLIQQMLQGVMGISSKEKITFTRNIGMMIRAGIPVTEALLYFESFVTNKKFRAIVNQVRTDIMAGNSLSTALSKHKKVFDDVYVNVTRAGERSGELDQTMGRLTDLMVAAEKIKMKIISASVYPIIVMVIVVLVLILMFLLVIPTFVDIYEKLGVPLPWITQVLFATSGFLKNWWFIAFPALGFSAFGIYKYFTGATGKMLLDAVVLKIPVLGELIKYVENSHFVSTLYVGFGAGLPITDALYLAAQTVEHTQIRTAFQQVNIQIQSGQRLGVALTNSGYVPELVLLMISTGEESGDLEKMLESSFDYLEEEINHRVEILVSLLEPVLLLLVGLVVGFVAMAIYLPLFSMYEYI